MKSKLIVLTAPTSWNFTDESTGQFRQGNSAFCYLPFEGAVQSFSNLPAGLQVNFCYECELGFKVGRDRNGKPTTTLTITSVSQTGKQINWESVCK